MAQSALSTFFRPWRTVLMVASLSLVLPLPGAVVPGMQYPGAPPPVPQLPPDAMSDNTLPKAANAEKLERLREDDRRKRLLADTARLVELSNELKTDVEKTPKDALSMDVVRKAAEIEKLAHDVRERMKS